MPCQLSSDYLFLSLFPTIFYFKLFVWTQTCKLYHYGRSFFSLVSIHFCNIFFYSILSGYSLCTNSKRTSLNSLYFSKSFDIHEFFHYQCLMPKDWSNISLSALVENEIGLGFDDPQTFSTFSFQWAPETLWKSEGTLKAIKRGKLCNFCLPFRWNVLIKNKME